MIFIFLVVAGIKKKNLSICDTRLETKIESAARSETNYGENFWQKSTAMIELAKLIWLIISRLEKC